MIFVTVGTHEQPFNRLVEYMDKWAMNHEEEVVIQYGYSTYIPKFAIASKLYSYKEMNGLIKRARIVITHGGPSSFIAVLDKGKNPIVVPRQCKYGEHVNDHQLHFCNKLVSINWNLNIVENIQILGEKIDRYDSKISDIYISNTRKFNDLFVDMVKKLFNK